MNRTLPLHYIPESAFVCIFLLLELTLQQETHIYINLPSLYKLFVLFFSSFDNTFILIGHPKHCKQNRRTRGVLKVDRRKC